MTNSSFTSHSQEEEVIDEEIEEDDLGHRGRER